MIYDNCIKYIREEADKNYSPREWREKSVLFLGMDSLAKALIHVLKEYGSEIGVLDEKYRLGSYSDILVGRDP